MRLKLPCTLFPCRLSNEPSVMCRCCSCSSALIHHSAFYMDQRERDSVRRRRQILRWGRAVIDDVSQALHRVGCWRGGQLTAPPVVSRRTVPLFSGRINDAFIALNMSAPLNASAVPAMSAEGNPALVFWGVGLLAELRATWLTDRYPSQAQLR